MQGIRNKPNEILRDIELSEAFFRILEVIPNVIIDA